MTTTHPVTEMLELAQRSYKGEEMLIKAACRACGIGPQSICDAEEAAALVIEAGWTWGDVLNASA